MKILFEKSPLVDLIYDEIDPSNENRFNQMQMVLSLKSILSDVESDDYIKSILSHDDYVEMLINSFNIHHYTDQFLLLLRLYCYNPNIINKIKFSYFIHEDIFNQISDCKEWNYNIDYNICNKYYPLLFPVVKYFPIEVFNVKNSLIEVKKLKMEVESDENKFKAELPVYKFKFSKNALLCIINNLHHIKTLNIRGIY